MSAPVTRWGLLWRSENRLDGVTTHLVCYNRIPALFVTRDDARSFANAHFGYIRHRPDLHREPHGWSMPQPIRVTVAPAIADQSPKGRDAKRLDAKHASGGARSAIARKDL